MQKFLPKDSALSNNARNLLGGRVITVILDEFGRSVVIALQNAVEVFVAEYSGLPGEDAFREQARLYEVTQGEALVPL